MDNEHEVIHSYCMICGGPEDNHFPECDLYIPFISEPVLVPIIPPLAPPAYYWAELHQGSCPSLDFLNYTYWQEK